MKSAEKSINSLKVLNINFISLFAAAYIFTNIIFTSIRCIIDGKRFAIIDDGQSTLNSIEGALLVTKHQKTGNTSCL